MSVGLIVIITNREVKHSLTKTMNTYAKNGSQSKLWYQMQNMIPNVKYGFPCKIWFPIDTLRVYV